MVFERNISEVGGRWAITGRQKADYRSVCPDLPLAFYRPLGQPPAPGLLTQWMLKFTQ